MRKATTSILLALLLLFSLGLQLTEARSGCCSHHGGVCGCGCCDGSSLSAICAPYYPQCSNATNAGSSAITNTDQPTQANIPAKTQVQVFYTPHPTVTQTATLTPTKKPTPQPTKKVVRVDTPAQQAKPQPQNFWTALLKFFHLL